MNKDTEIKSATAIKTKIENLQKGFEKQIKNPKLTPDQKLQIVQFNLEKLSQFIDTSFYVAKKSDFYKLLVKMVNHDEVHPDRLNKWRGDFGSLTLEREKRLLSWAKKHPSMKWYLTEDPDVDFSQTVDNINLNYFGKDHDVRLLDEYDDYVSGLTVVKPDDMDYIFSDLLEVVDED